jgi:hypothetical protein
MLLAGALVNCRHTDLTDVRDACERARQRRSLRGASQNVFPTQDAGWLFNGFFLQPIQHHWVEWRRIANVILLSCNTAQLWKTGGFIGDENKAQYTAHVTDIPLDSPYYEKATALIREGTDPSAVAPLYEIRSLVVDHDPNVQEWLISFYGEAVFLMRIMPTGDDNFESAFLPGVRINNGPSNATFWREFTSTGQAI